MNKLSVKMLLVNQYPVLVFERLLTNHYETVEPKETMDPGKELRDKSDTLPVYNNLVLK